MSHYSDYPAACSQVPWDRGGGIEVGPWPGGWSRRYRFWTRLDETRRLFLDFHTLVVRDGIDPQAVHREFLKLGEYRERIAPDISGAE